MFGSEAGHLTRSLVTVVSRQSVNFTIWPDSPSPSIVATCMHGRETQRHTHTDIHTPRALSLSLSHTHTKASQAIVVLMTVSLIRALCKGWVGWVGCVSVSHNSREPSAQQEHVTDLPRCLAAVPPPPQMRRCSPCCCRCKSSV